MVAVQWVGHCTRKLVTSWTQTAANRLLFNSSLGGKVVGCLGGKEVKCKIESTSAVILLLILVLNLVLSLNPDSDPGS